jgi:hypothetical protein
MPERYRVRLDDGQVFDMHATPAVIRRYLKDSDFEGRIEGRIVIDDLGQGRIVPYGGEQPTESNEEPDYEALTVAQLRDAIEGRELDRPPADAKKADLIAIVEADDERLRSEATQS